jgi:hypothetical protein
MNGLLYRFIGNMACCFDLSTMARWGFPVLAVKACLAVSGYGDKWLAACGRGG